MMESHDQVSSNCKDTHYPFRCKYMCFPVIIQPFLLGSSTMVDSLSPKMVSSNNWLPCRPEWLMWAGWSKKEPWHSHAYQLFPAGSISNWCTSAINNKSCSLWFFKGDWRAQGECLYKLSAGISIYQALFPIPRVWSWMLKSDCSALPRLPSISHLCGRGDPRGDVMIHQWEEQCTMWVLSWAGVGVRIKFCSIPVLSIILGSPWNHTHTIQQNRHTSQCF